MSFPSYPNFQVIGVALQAHITVYNSGTGDFTFTSGTSSYTANWNTDVIANVINTISRSAGATGRLNLTAAKAASLRLTGWQSAGSNVGGTDYASYTSLSATVRGVSGNNVTLSIGGVNRTVDWRNPSHVWTGAETTITPVVNSTGAVRIGDAHGRSNGMISGGGDKWPLSLRLRAAAEVRVQVVDADRRVVVLDAQGLPIEDQRGNVMTWRLPADGPELRGFDAVDSAPQQVQIGHALKAQLGLP